MQSGTFPVVERDTTSCHYTICSAAAVITHLYFCISYKNLFHTCLVRHNLRFQVYLIVL